MARLLSWSRRHPIVVDTLLVLALFGVTSLVWFGHRDNGQTATLVLVGVPLALRRRYPRAVFATVAAAALLQYLTDTPLQLIDAAVLVALWTIAARGRRVDTVIAAAVVEVGIWLAAFRFSVNPWLTIMVLNIVAAAGVLIAETMRVRRDYLAELEARATRLERERDQQTQLATAAERARIARELHDIVAHNVSVMVAQADGARFTIDTDAPRAIEAMQVISATGREALAEMRHLVDVLRPDRTPGETTPQPGIAQLDELVARLRDAGMHVELHTDGTPRPMPAGTALAAYRIVQEALTNTIKHAGRGALADVLIRYDDDRIRIRVDDDGSSQAHASAWPSGAGHGLVGMRERAEMYGGSLRAGRRPDGGYRVEAELPARAAS